MRMNGITQCSGDDSSPSHVPNTTCAGKQNHPPGMSFRRSHQRSGGIHPSSNNNLRKVKLATWEDPSTPFHFGRDDMSEGGSVLSARVVFATSPERHTGRSLRFRWWVVPLNRSGYHCNVAGKGLYLFQILNFLLHFFDNVEINSNL